MISEVQIEGFRNPIWLPAPIEGSKRLEVERSLIEIEERLKPATKEQILTLLTALAEYYGISKQEGLETRFEMMVQDLHGYSMPHIEMAIAEHRRVSNFYPKSPELLATLGNRKHMAIVMRHRSRVLLGLDEPQKYELDMLERFKSQCERKAAAASAPDASSLEDRLKSLPAPLAEQTRRLVQAAQKTEERRSA